MADRRTLHINKLEEFKKWLEKDGWDIEKPKGEYEVLRARKEGRKDPVIVYTKKDAKQHLSVMDKDLVILKAFLRDSKMSITNADRIRSMSDKELAEWIATIDHYWNDGECIISFGDSHIQDSQDAILEWLQCKTDFS